MRPLRPSIVLLACLALTGCGGDSGPADAGSRGGSQAQLDETTESVDDMLEVLESAYPEDDDSVEAVAGAFSDAMVERDLVDEVRQVEGWDLDTPLPCGEQEEPTLGVIATGDDREFFIGTTSEAFIAGFAEDGEGDLGVVVAPCSEGRSGDLHLVELPDDDASLRVAVQSFSEPGEPAAEAIDALYDAYERDEPPRVTERQQGWRLGEPISCPDSDGDPVAIGSAERADYFAGYGTSDVVAVFIEHAGADIGAFAAPCDDGRAGELRRIARPLDEALADR